MSDSYMKTDPNRNKPRKWIARHFGSFMQTGVGKDSTNSALNELCMQISDGRFRELQCTIEIDRDQQILIIKRWLDQVVIEEFKLMSITNVLSHQQIRNNNYLTNILSFNTVTKTSSNVFTETHIFQLDDSNFHMVNYLASDIRSAIESASNMNAKTNMIKVLPSSKKRNNSTTEKSNKVIDGDQIPKYHDISSRTERNLLLLNYCFDDIEFFLQHLKDQEEAQAILKSNKGKLLADRLLEGKAKPSTPNAYVTCIEKIKFSLNLLSKLDGKIKNPDSHQLVLLLIENLLKIGQAYSIYHNGKLSKIKEPLLSEHTIKLLYTTLSKHYQKQWMSWGEFWCKPKEKWNGYIEKYYPQFFNGYQIDLEELAKDGIISPLVEKPRRSISNSEINQTILSNQTLTALVQNPKLEVADLNPREEDFCRSVTLRNGRLFRVTDTFTASKDEELSMIEGEIIEAIEIKPEKNWWLCGNMHGQKGYIPRTILQPFHYIDKSMRTSHARPVSEQLSIDMSKVRQSPIPPTQKQASPLPKDMKPLEKTIEEAKSINEELKRRANPNFNFGAWNARASFARPGPIVSKKHGQLSINQDSTCEDVQKWLAYKKFSSNDIEKLKVFSGQTIFLLSRDEMNRIVGPDVATRLDSLIRVQKSLSGFGTLSRRELDQILTKRKEKVDFEESF